MLKILSHLAALIFSLWAISSCSKKNNDFTLDELQDLSDSDLSKFESHVLSKGYELGNNTVSLYFFSKKSNDSRKSDEHDDIISWEEESTRQIITYQSSDKDFYLRIKKEVEDSPYKFINRTVNGVDTRFHYAGKNGEITLVTIPKSEAIGVEKNYYRIEITKQLSDK